MSVKRTHLLPFLLLHPAISTKPSADLHHHLALAKLLSSVSDRSIPNFFHNPDIGVIQPLPFQTLLFRTTQTTQGFSCQTILCCMELYAGLVLFHQPLWTSQRTLMPYIGRTVIIRLFTNNLLRRLSSNDQHCLS